MLFHKKLDTESLMPVDEARVLLAKIKSGEIKPCSHCFGIHARACPRVKRMVFIGEEVKEIEFWQDWPTADIIWPDEIEGIVLHAEENGSV